MKQQKDIWMSPSLIPPCRPILFASSPRVSRECQLSTCQITPDHSFSLPISTKDRPCLGLLCQGAGDTWAFIAYLSKQLDMATKGWLPCIYLPRLTITSGFPLPSLFQGTGPTCLSPRPSALILPLLSPSPHQLVTHILYNRLPPT